MRPDLPWNVAGIPPEAREAARAAARREGLSVGEWLTRRILRSFADAGDELEMNRDSWTTPKMYRADEQPPSSRDTDEMLDRTDGDVGTAGTRRRLRLCQRRRQGRRPRQGRALQEPAAAGIGQFALLSHAVLR